MTVASAGLSSAKEKGRQLPKKARPTDPGAGWSVVVYLALAVVLAAAEEG